MSIVYNSFASYMHNSPMSTKSCRITPPWNYTNMKLSIVVFFVFITMSSAADILQNSGFETPPTNISSNASIPSYLLTQANSIPGWSFNGTIWYLNSSFKGHAVQLGENGRINQTFKGTNKDLMNYILTFTLSAQNEDCTNYRTAVNVTAQDRSRSLDDRSTVFILDRNFSSNLWQNYAFYLGMWGKGDSVNIEIRSVATISDANNVSCWPVVDDFTIKKNILPRWYNGNSFSNGDFEIGPAFLKNSSSGILLNQEPVTDVSSTLQEWSIIGEVRYIDSNHYKIPHGKSAIQLVAVGAYGISMDPNIRYTYGYGGPSGIQAGIGFEAGSSYVLNFTIGDANDSCVGNLMVFLKIRYQMMNFTIQSNGTGSTFHHSLKFKVDSATRDITTIGFYSVNETRRANGVLCGPVLDNITLHRSDGNKIMFLSEVFSFSLFLVLIILL